MATITIAETAQHKPFIQKNSSAREIEYEVLFGHVTEPTLRLAGKIGVIQHGRRDLALSDEEWQDLGLPDDSAVLGQEGVADVE